MSRPKVGRKLAVRLSDETRAKVLRRGGSEFARKVLDAAVSGDPEPAPLTNDPDGLVKIIHQAVTTEFEKGEDS